VLTTPAFQEYPSGHSGVSSAAVTQLASLYGDHTPFVITSDGISPAASTARTYPSFSAALQDIALARIAAGIHFRFACDAAAQVGAAVASYVSATEMIRLHGRGGEGDDDD
jgi:PAP2 superfamily